MQALISGRGSLPRILYDQMQEKPFVASLSGFLPDDLEPDHIFCIENVGSFIKDLKKRGVTQVCFAGGIERPSFNIAKFDFATTLLLPKIQKAIQNSDGHALAIVTQVFESKGFEVIGAHHIAPDLCPTAGVMTDKAPSDKDLKDISRAQNVHKAMSDADIGQACVISAGQVLAAETLAGTDWMLSSLTQRPAHYPDGGVLFKTSKLGQDLRIDMATLGVQTVENAIKAGLSGICVGAGQVLMLEREAMIERANAAGLFIVAQYL